MAKILIVEDNLHTSAMVSMTLERKGAVVVCVSDGLKAFEEIKKFLPEVIILDLMLPGLSGDELIVKLLNMEEYRRIPIVVITAKAEIEEKIVYSPNVKDILFKPFQMEHLTDTIETVLKESNN